MKTLCPSYEEDFSFLNSVFFKRTELDNKQLTYSSLHKIHHQDFNSIPQLPLFQTVFPQEKESENKEVQADKAEKDQLIDADKEFYCQECQKQYKNKKTFNSHVQTQHNTTRPFKCAACSHSFKRPDYLQKHLDSHKQERNFPCESCEQKFKSKQTLEKHVKTVHKRVICGYCRCCNKGFTRKDYLKKHMQRGEQRYVCNVCEKRFASKQSMERHCITKHTQ